jgi:TolA-binding protein
MAGDGEDRAERARAKSAKDKASDEIEPLRRCVREQSGAQAVDCRYRLFDALFRAGRCADAVSAAEQAVSAAPADPRAADTLLDAASCLENLGRLDRARVFYQRVAKEYPAHAAEARRALLRLP